MKSTCDLYDDFLDAVRVIPPGLKNFGGRSAFHGEAVTIKCFEDNSRLVELVNSAGAGRVLMVDGGGSLRCAIMGDMLADAAAKNGWSGVVISGCVRDRQALAALPIGIMALGVTPRKSTRRGEGQRDLAISVLGTAVYPGDFVVADSDGCLVFPEGIQRPAKP
jgi:regulator of ribonuclease activity A